LEECLAKKVWSFSRNYTKKRPKKKKKNCKLDDEESVHTGQSNEEIIPKPKKRQSRRTLFGVEVEKSENHEEEAPIDFLVNLMIGNVSITKVPSSPVFLENSMNIGLIGSFKLPFPFDVEIPFACQRGVCKTLLIQLSTLPTTGASLTAAPFGRILLAKTSKW
jgi:hypothetical protein